MIKFGGFPTLCTVAGFASRTEATLMRFIFGVAVQALVRCVLEVGTRTSVTMALGAGQIQMDPGEVKIYQRMVELFSDRFDPIVAGKAILTVRDLMRCGKHQIFLLMAIDTGLVVEGRIFPGMTIDAFGIFMDCQRKS
jgi:hypothetical protein